MTTTATLPISNWNKIYLVVCGAFVASVFLLLSVNLGRVTSAYAVNVLYWDQWDFYRPLFDHAGWWDCFDFQHGPHRQGVGMLLTRVLAKFGHWNSRWDSFGVFGCLVAAGLLAIPLAWKAGVRQPLLLAGVPLIYLNIRQYEGLVDSSNISHGAMPVLLFTLYCLAWFTRQTPVRLALICVLTFGLIFTGFGIFVGLITPIVLIVELVQAVLAKKPAWAACVVVALLAVAASWWAFKQNYYFDPSVADFTFPWKSPMDYLYFVSLMLANFFGVGHGISGTIEPYVTIFGSYVFGGLILICGIHAWRMVRSGVLAARSSVVIFVLSGYSLIYLVNTAVGRVSLDWRVVAMSGRYVTLLIPAGMAILLHLATLRRRWVAVSSAMFYLLLLAFGTWTLYPKDIAECELFHDGRQAWKTAYLEDHDESKADRTSGFAIYPNPNTITDRLEYLRKNRLNLFADGAKSGN
jgi:hypothetical protein